MESVFINDRVRDGNGVPVLDPGGGSGTLYTDLLTDTLYVWDGSAWQTVIGGGGGTPGGLNTQVQYNNAGAFGGITGATTDGITLTLVAPVLGTPASGTLTNCTGLPVGSITGLGANIATWLATPSSANLAAAVTDETGTAGNLVFSTAPSLTGPVTVNEAVGSSGLTLTGATQVSNFPVLSATQTWNASGTIFTAMKLNITNTASDGASLLLDLRVGNNTVLSVGRTSGSAGNMYLTGSDASVSFSLHNTGTGGKNLQFFSTNNSNGFGGGVFGVYDITSANGLFATQAGGAFCVGSAGKIGFSSNTNPIISSFDAFIMRAAAATLQMGLDVNGAATSQMLQAANGITGADRTGGNLTLASGKGTGAGAVSSVFIQTPTALGAGSTAQSLTTRVTVDVNGIKATGYLSADGSSGVSAGPFTTISSITVKNGLVTALAGS